MDRKTTIAHDLVLPCILFAALGAMSWAVRGSSGYGGSSGCIFAGVLWGAAWWFIARRPGGEQVRRYTSGWIVLALAFGIGISGNRGWAQWPNFFEGRLYTDYGAGEFVAISPAYGFLWMFIAGAPWAAVGACMLAWCGSLRPVPVWQWALRIGSGAGAAVLATYLFNTFPQWFLPLYSTMPERYQDFEANHNLYRLTNDCRAAVQHMGLMLGFLSFEIGRRDWKNVVLIVTVAAVNGLGWALLQNWKWADDIWPGASFNWWRCWESSGGISIGIAYGVAYFLVNRPMGAREREIYGERAGNIRPNLERFGLYLGLVYGLGLSIKNGLKGWANIYLGNEDYWEAQFWRVIGPLMALTLIVLGARIWMRQLPKGYEGDLFPHAYVLLWMVLIVQNVMAQLITGPWSGWNEVVFSIFYGIMFVLSGVIVYHYGWVKKM